MGNGQWAGAWQVQVYEQWESSGGVICLDSSVLCKETSVVFLRLQYSYASREMEYDSRESVVYTKRTTRAGAIRAVMSNPT